RSMSQLPSKSSSQSMTPPPPEGTPSFSTPLGIVLGSLLLCLVGIVAAAAAHVANLSLDVQSPSAHVTVSYLFYVPSIFFFLVGIVTLIIGAVRWAIYGKDALGPTANSAHGASDAYADLLHSINDRLLLSDTAKRIAYRQHDLAALRRAIREDIDKGQFDAAMVLV